MILNLHDCEAAARKRLPRCLFEFIEGGSEDGVTVRANRAAFDSRRLVPRVLRDTAARQQRCTTLGMDWSSPFGIAPMGAAGLACFQADLVLARAARAAGIPFILSGASLVSLERVLEANPQAWFQLYPSSHEPENQGLLARLRAAGYGTLVVTADVPVGGNRERDVRNGYGSPLRPSFKLARDAALRPRWLLRTFLRTLATEGMPHFENFAAGRAPMFSRTAVRQHRRDSLTWDWLASVRAQWPGKLVLKGVLAPEDAEAAARLGLDGVIVSNHGGRQLDGAAAPLDQLAAVKAASGRMAVMLDSGVRRGTDALKALALGAEHLFVGRPFLYAAATGGEEGVAQAIKLLRSEIDRDMALLGCVQFSELAERLAA